ncbi:phage regulatory protein/antirepressor Ant [Lactiplantibacillus sp. WILCCON 0030]|uniref:Phage regulatory protein/antirepressor Ant n=1 Tax=Lactiplantibacillus brownii TaxID=3069269 RepID=A0ABU1A863_9LACO|nr:phage regulatory protein/antirepressor Ant [Lactiplantibacillus brownii]MDQ7937066.1 phage regulatory protein/antirepressor Ant [Lactiplantibacillus brownii]
MSDLVTMHDQQAVTTSLQVAEVFGKNHPHVLRSLDELKKDVSNFGYMFVETKIPDSYGRMRRAFYMNRDGFTLLAMGFTGSKALEFKLQYIEAFNRMEKRVSQFDIPATLPEALRLAADQAEQITIMKPKAEYTDKMLSNPGLETTSMIAKNYGYSATAFNKLLNGLGIQFKQGKTWLLYAKYQDKGYTHVEPYEYVNSEDLRRVRNTMKWTQKGVKFLYDFLRRQGILPLVEQLDGEADGQTSMEV